MGKDINFSGGIGGDNSVVETKLDTLIAEIAKITAVETLQSAHDGLTGITTWTLPDTHEARSVTVIVTAGSVSINGEPAITSTSVETWSVNDKFQKLTPPTIAGTTADAEFRVIWTYKEIPA